LPLTYIGGPQLTCGTTGIIDPVEVDVALDCGLPVLLVEPGMLVDELASIDDDAPPTPTATRAELDAGPSPAPLPPLPSESRNENSG